MKIISIRFNDYLANWILSNCQKSKISISEFIRDVLYTKMKDGSIEINKLKINNARKKATAQKHRTEMGYTIFAAKLLEEFILATVKNGLELRNAAFKETEELLNELKLNNNSNNEQRFCISLEQELFGWLANESARLQIKIISLIRKLVEDSFIVSSSVINLRLSKIQKIAVANQLKACKLIEELVRINTKDAEFIIENAHSKTEEILTKMYE